MNPAPHLECPLPLQQYPRILLAHGGGGRLMHDLISRMFAAAFSNPILDRHHDAAVLPDPHARLAFTTDSYVVQPLFFPGGDIGSLAVHGTVNDLAMSGAQPLALSTGFILQEGLPMDTLWRIVQSMQRAASHIGVPIVTGDTKVVNAGRGDGLYINTSGIGVLHHPHTLEPQSITPGDAVIVSGDLGRHGMAIMAVREGLQFESTIESDSAPLNEMVFELLSSETGVHCLRDLTRGGLAGTLNEISETSGHPIRLHADRIPVREDVRAACEILGLDVLQVACEGRLVAFIPGEQADRAVDCLRRHPHGAHAACVGEVLPSANGRPPEVLLAGSLGTERPLPMPAGEQLPRIC